MEKFKMTKVEKCDVGSKVKRGLLGVLLNGILIIFSASCIFPLVWMFYSSLKEKRAFNADIIGLPKEPTLLNYIKIMTNSDYHLGSSMFNSFLITLLSLFLLSCLDLL